MGLWGWMARAGLRGLARQKDVSEVFEGWRGLETITGRMGGFKDADDLWGGMSQRGHLASYSQVVLIMACVNRIVQSFREAPPEIGRLSPNGEWEATKDHPILRLLATPNPDMTRSQFNEYRLIQKLTAGESYVWEIRNSIGEVVELWPLPPHWVRPVLAKSMQDGHGNGRLISHFDVSFPGKTAPVSIPARDIIWDRFIDPADLSGSLSPLTAAHHAIRLGAEKDNYILEMLENYEVPPVVYETDKELNPRDRENLRAMLKQVMGKDGQKRGSSLLLDNSIKATALTPPLKDLDWPGLSSMTDSQICSVYGVPPLLVHTRMSQENTPLSSPNLEAAEQLFYRGTMMAVWASDAEIITRWLLWEEGYADEEMRYDLSPIRAFMDDLAELTSHCKDAVMASIMTINEARQKLGLPVDSGREGVYLLPVNMVEHRPATTTAADDGGNDGDEDWNGEDGDEDEDAGHDAGSGNDGDIAAFDERMQGGESARE